MVEAVVSVFEAVQHDLEALGSDLANSALAATALALAAELDKDRTGATSKSMCAGRLMEALEQLRALAPPRKESDGIDDIAAQRERRRAAAGGTAAAHMPRT